MAIGDELTSGQRIDTNSGWLSQRLGEIGIVVRFHTTVADDLDSLAAAMRLAMERADVVISTGGLGPTADDLTRQALSDAVGKPLRLDATSLDHIRGLFQRRGREMPERNQIQAMFPENSAVIPNRHGTAPGIDMKVNRSGTTSRIFCLPGVPAEMREMWTDTVSVALGHERPSERIIVHHRIKCFGIGESDLERRLPDLIARGREPSVGITVHKATITLRITAKGSTEAECRERMQPTIATIHDCLGSLVFGEEDDELQDAVIKSLAERGESLATHEIGTPGILARWLREADFQKRQYAGGLVVGSGVANAQALGTGVGSSESMKQLVTAAAFDIRKTQGATYGLAVGPFGAEDATNPQARFWLALATANEVLGIQARFAGHPAMVSERSAKQALNLLRRTLLGLSPE